MTVDLTGTRVRVRPPSVPRFTIGGPTSSPRVVVLPVRGAPGSAGSAAGTYAHAQTTPAAEWTIVHGLGRKPDVALFLTGEPQERVYTDLAYPDLDTILVSWPSPESGEAFVG